CRPCSSWKACWRACRTPPRSSPSTVSTSAPSHCTVRTVQDFTDMPLQSTVQAPQCEVSQPICGPVWASFSRSVYMRNSRGSTSTATASPFNLKETGCVFATMRSSFARSAFGARRRHLQCAAGHLTAHGGLVGHITALVDCWITDAHSEARGLAETGFIEGLPHERRFRGAGPQGRRSRVCECDRHARDLAVPHLERGGR